MILWLYRLEDEIKPRKRIQIMESSSNIKQYSSDVNFLSIAIQWITNLFKVILSLIGQTHFSVDAQVPVPRSSVNLLNKVVLAPFLSAITLFFPKESIAQWQQEEKSVKLQVNKKASFLLDLSGTFHFWGCFFEEWLLMLLASIESL